MSATGYLTSKGQTTVPKAVRDKLGMRIGSKLEWTVEGDRVFVTVEAGRMVDLAGILGNPLGRAVTIEEMDEGIAQGIAERYRRAVDRR